MLMVSATEALYSKPVGTMELSEKIQLRRWRWNNRTLGSNSAFKVVWITAEAVQLLNKRPKNSTSTLQRHGTNIKLNLTSLELNIELSTYIENVLYVSTTYGHPFFDNQLDLRKVVHHMLLHKLR